MRSRTMPKPSWNLEFLMWVFTRISGISLVLLACNCIISCPGHGGQDPNGPGSLDALGVLSQPQSCPGQQYT